MLRNALATWHVPRIQVEGKVKTTRCKMGPFFVLIKQMSIKTQFTRTETLQTLKKHNTPWDNWIQTPDIQKTRYIFIYLHFSTVSPATLHVHPSFSVAVEKWAAVLQIWTTQSNVNVDFCCCCSKAFPHILQTSFRTVRHPQPSLEMIISTETTCFWHICRESTQQALFLGGVLHVAFVEWVDHLAILCIYTTTVLDQVHIKMCKLGLSLKSCLPFTPYLTLNVYGKMYTNA